MKRGIALVAALGASVALAHSASAAPVQWTGVGSNGHFYEYITGDSTLTWQSAESGAAALTFGGSNGYLATSTSAGENNFILSLLTSANAVWLGASDAASEGNWQWVTGEPFTFANWNAGEPNGGTGENFLQMYGILTSQGTAGEWNDAPSPVYNITGYVAEFNVAQTPIPAALPLFATALVGLGALGRRRKKATGASLEA